MEKRIDICILYGPTMNEKFLAVMTNDILRCLDDVNNSVTVDANSPGDYEVVYCEEFAESEIDAAGKRHQEFLLLDQMALEALVKVKNPELKPVLYS